MAKTVEKLILFKKNSIPYCAVKGLFFQANIKLVKFKLLQRIQTNIKVDNKIKDCIYLKNGNPKVFLFFFYINRLIIVTCKKKRNLLVVSEQAIDAWICVSDGHALVTIRVQ
jgi:hypothetical protein